MSVVTSYPNPLKLVQTVSSCLEDLHTTSKTTPEDLTRYLLNQDIYFGTLLLLLQNKASVEKVCCNVCVNSSLLWHQSFFFKLDNGDYQKQHRKKKSM